MTPEEIAEQVFNDYLHCSIGHLVIKKGEILRKLITHAITQVKCEAYEEGYKNGAEGVECQFCGNQMTYKDMQAAIKNLSELPDCMKGSAPNTAVAAIKALSGGKND